MVAWIVLQNIMECDHHHSAFFFNGTVHDNFDIKWKFTEDMVMHLAAVIVYYDNILPMLKKLLTNGI